MKVKLDKLMKVKLDKLMKVKLNKLMKVKLNKSMKVKLKVKLTFNFIIWIRFGLNVLLIQSTAAGTLGILRANINIGRFRRRSANAGKLGHLLPRRNLPPGRRGRNGVSKRRRSLLAQLGHLGRQSCLLRVNHFQRVFQGRDLRSGKQEAKRKKNQSTFSSNPTSDPFRNFGSLLQIRDDVFLLFDGSVEIANDQSDLLVLCLHSH
jgi:hypothetical protein